MMAFTWCKLVCGFFMLSYKNNPEGIGDAKLERGSVFLNPPKKKPGYVLKTFLQHTCLGPIQTCRRNQSLRLLYMAEKSLIG